MTPEHHYQLAESYRIKNAIPDAQKQYYKVLQLDPKHSDAHAMLGLFASYVGDFEKASLHFDEALSLKPNQPEILFQYATLLRLNRRYTQAVVQLKKLLTLQPDHLKGICLFTRVLDELCYWDGREERIGKLHHYVREALSKGVKPELDPFNAMHYPWSPSLQKALTESHANDLAVQPVSFSSAVKKQPVKRLRVGYVSNDFYEHATAQLIVDLFATHDPENIESFVYSYSKDDDSKYRKKIESDCDHFIDISAFSDDETAEIIAGTGIHILIDLKGHTQGSRLGIFARRPAPIQMTYLGYPGTSGAQYIDYIITDTIVTPRSTYAYCTEKPLVLPNCYQVNNRLHEVSDEPITRKAHGLPEKAFVFASFNHSFKITPRLFQAWMEILKASPNSVLWLYQSSPDIKPHILREAAAKNIDETRIIFAPSAPKELHLARHRLADLFLDTHRVNAHTTASDALWVGLPILTISGMTFPSRVCASLLFALDLPELVVSDMNDYIHRAVYLSTHPEMLRQLKDRLQQNRLTHPLFDIERFTKNLEKGYQLAWDHYVSGAEHDAIVVEEESNGVDVAQRHFNDGLTCHQAGELTQAKQYYERCLKIIPHHYNALSNLAAVCQDLGQLELAIQLMVSATCVNPSAEAYSNLGCLYRTANQYERSEHTLQLSIQMDKNFSLGYANLGYTRYMRGFIDDAIKSCQKAVEINPNNITAWLNMGLSFVNQARHEEGIKAFDEVLKRDPKNATALSNKLYSAMYHAELSFEELAKYHFETGKILSQDIVPMREWKNVRDKNRPLKIGIVSSDMKRHPIGYLIAPIFEQMDKANYPLYFYQNVFGYDDYTDRIKSYAQAWHDIKGMSVEQVVQQIQKDEIDILIDINGHTARNSLSVFAHKPAPIQVSYLGYPNTTGLPTIDYLLVDDVVCPDGSEALYTEKFLKLSQFPFCFEKLDELPPVSKTPAKKNKHITFGSYNHTPKLNPFTIQLWSDLLNAIPDSKLRLTSRSFSDPGTVSWFKKQFSEHHVDADRVTFVGPLPYPELLKSYELIDIALDPYPFNGGRTSYDALSMGVPIVTLAGKNYASRMGASLLTSVGLEEGIATSAKEYIEKAKELSSDVDKLNSLRLKLRDKLLKSACADAKHVAKNIETLLRGAWVSFIVT